MSGLERRQGSGYACEGFGWGADFEGQGEVAW